MNRFEYGDITVIRAALLTPGEPSNPKEPEDDLFLMHRVADNKILTRNLNMWEMPGGQIGRDELNPFTAVIRQIFKKTGLVVEFREPQLSCVEWRTMEDDRLYAAYLCIAHYCNGKVQLTEEHDDSGWFNIDRLEGFKLASQAAIGVSMHRERTLGVVDIAGPHAIEPPDSIDY